MANIHYSLCDYGFQYGGAEITRCCSDEKKGWVVLELKTAKKRLQTYVTKTGKVRIHEEGAEWLPLFAKNEE